MTCYDAEVLFTYFVLIRQDLTRAINNKNESEIKAKAGTHEVKGFNIIKTPKDEVPKKTASS
jgi:hypothetical protein